MTQMKTNKQVIEGFHTYVLPQLRVTFRGERLVEATAQGWRRWLEKCTQDGLITHEQTLELESLDVWAHIPRD